MARFSSYQYVPTETRRILRDRFASKLPVARQDRYLNPDLPLTPDLIVLRLLEGLTISSNADWATAAAAYSALAPCGSEPSDLDALAEIAWIRKVWDRVRVPMDLRIAAGKLPDGVAPALKALVACLPRRSFTFDETARSNPELADLLASVASGEDDLRGLNVLNPDWIAARLWETCLQRAASSKAALRTWVDLWRLLDQPGLVPATAWGAADTQAFQEGALDLVARDEVLMDWAATRDLFVRQAALASGLNIANAEAHFEATPETLVDRALWVERPVVESHAFEALSSLGDLFGLVRLLLADVNAVDNARAPHPTAVRILDLAAGRAELFIALLFQIRAKPKLLADVLLHPPTSALACLLVGQWRPVGGAWDRELLSREWTVAHAEAFTDALAILGQHLRDGRSTPVEAVALQLWLQRRAGPGFVDDVQPFDALASAFRRELSICPPPTILAMAQSLLGRGPDPGLGTSALAALLDLIDIGDLSPDIDGKPIIDAYATSVAAGDYSLSAHRIGRAGAAALAKLSEASLEVRQHFLTPFDVRAKLTAPDREPNPYTLADHLGRSVRAHIRILCRAVVGGPKVPAADLLDSLGAWVKAGALDHQSKGRVAAFAPRYEERPGGGQPLDRPIAVDLAAALTRLTGEAQKRLLAAVLETDEPLLLAQVLARCPPALRPAISDRIAAIAPDDAGHVLSYTEVTARIDALLNAGAAEAAATYMTAERALSPDRSFPGRELFRFRAELRLAYARQDWPAIKATRDPTFKAQLEQEAALETLQLYRGIAALRGPTPNPAAAKDVFARLFAKRLSLAFATNWFAAAISELLATNHFGLLDDRDVRAGQAVIAEVDRMTSELPDGALDEVLECNRALLLLALGEPNQALAVLSAAPTDRLQDVAAAYRAIAYSRLGRLAEATAALDEADRAFGKTDVLAAARASIASAAPYLAVPTVSLHDDLMANLDSAIARLRLMNPNDQARILHPGPDPFETLLTTSVRSAADAVMKLVPMMKSVQLDKIEDDLSAVIQHLLIERLQFLNWSVSDQGKGGFTAKGNAGERDLIVSRDGTILALIEAVNCKKPTTQDVVRADLESHFQKLLAYGSTRIFFHLTYAYIDDPASVLGFLQTAAEMATPREFTYLGQEPIPHEDSRPPGLVARYQGDFGEVKVIFLVLNMTQNRQRQAAKRAAATKNRRVKPGKP